MSTYKVTKLVTDVKSSVDKEGLLLALRYVSLERPFTLNAVNLVSATESEVNCERAVTSSEVRRVLDTFRSVNLVATDTSREVNEVLYALKFVSATKPLKFNEFNFWLL